MANYNETNDAGTAWTRAYSVHIQNPLDSSQRKFVTFFEEDVANIAGRIVHEPKGFLEVDFNPAEEIVLRDPITGTETASTVTHQYLYQILYSLYRNKAEYRDATWYSNLRDR